MASFEVKPDLIYQISLPGSGSVEVCNGSGDHAVRFKDSLSWLDHIVVFTPIDVPIELDDGLDGTMTLLSMQRYFIGKKAVESIVALTGLNEIYASELTESVHEDYLEQQGNSLDDLDFDVFDEGEED